MSEHGSDQDAATVQRFIIEVGTAGFDPSTAPYAETLAALDRLTARIAVLEGDFAQGKGLVDAYTALSAESQRLREALERLVAASDLEAAEGYGDQTAQAPIEFFQAVRAALAPTEEA